MNDKQQSTINHIVARFKAERNLDATYNIRICGHFTYVQFHVSTPNPFPELRLGMQGGLLSDARCRGGEIRRFPNPAMNSWLYADECLVKQIRGRRVKFGLPRAKPILAMVTARPAHSIPPAADREQACDLLAGIAGRLFCLHREELEGLKRRYANDVEEPDFLWRSLVESASGWGNSRGYEGLFGNPASRRKVTFEALCVLSPADRISVLADTLLAAGVRWHNKKAEQLSANLRRIEQMGGPAAAKVKLLSQPTRDAKIAFLERFAGIGPKFARNIFMNPYHPEFRESIAIDSRIQSISAALGLSFRTYAEEEQFYLGVAKRAGLSGWELDRLIYNFERQLHSGLKDAGLRGGTPRSGFCAD